MARLTLPLPYGHHLLVFSDLLLRENRSSRGLEELLRALHESDDPTVIVVAGNFLDLTEGSVAATLDIVCGPRTELGQSLRRWRDRADTAFVLLPGERDALLAREDNVALLATLGIDVADDLMVQVATATGVRDLAVAVAQPLRDHGVANEVPESALLEDPRAVARFVSSRTIYRRFGVVLLLPLILLALGDVSAPVLLLASQLSRHHFDATALRPPTWWGDVIWNVLFFGILEALLVTLAGLFVRRRFRRRAASTPPEALDPLRHVDVEGVDALEFARRIGERGGAGAVVGGCTSPALSFLDRGMVATPGPSREVVVEHRGRLGLPPTFRTEDRAGVVRVEAGSTVRVSLACGSSSLTGRRPVAEWLATGPALGDFPNEDTRVVATWPTGEPFPHDREAPQRDRRRRLIQRTASFLLAFDGVANVLASAAPPLRTRLTHVTAILPIGLAQSAAAITAIVGVALIMLARGVRRGQRRSWFIATMLLCLATITHLARGGSIEGSLSSLVVLGVLLAGRHYFQGRTDRVGTRAIVPRLVAINLGAVLAATVGIAASGRHQHLPKVPVIFWGCVERLAGISSINLGDGLVDFATPVLGAMGFVSVIIGLYLVTRPVVDRRLSHANRSAERRLAEVRARDIVRRYGRGTLDYFALRDDKQFFFFRDTLVAYAVYGGVALVSPDPIGPLSEATEAWHAFSSFAGSRGWTVGIVGASEEWLPRYHAAGLHSLYVGDEAIVDIPSFTLAGGDMKGLRQACGRLEKKGYTVAFYDPASLDPELVPALRELVAMLRRGENERGFSMMLGRLFHEKDKGLLLTVVSGPDSRPAAVCQFVPSPAIKGYSLDLMRRDPGEHPNGLIDFALCATIEHLQQHGATGLSLNFAAFRGVLDGERGEGPFTRVERWALQRLSGFLQIESLWRFNAKYLPRWQPRYLVYPAAESFVPVVAAVLRAESLTEIPVIGRLLSNDPANRPGTVISETV